MSIKWNGKYIKELLKENNMTQKQLSKELNVSKQTINSWINGTVPKGKHLVQMIIRFNADIDKFFIKEVPNIIIPSLHIDY